MTIDNTAITEGEWSQNKEDWRIYQMNVYKKSIITLLWFLFLTYCFVSCVWGQLNLNVSSSGDIEKTSIASTYQELNLGNWTPASGVVITNNGVEGQISGTQDGKWQYGTISLLLDNIEPGDYRLECWMKVDSISDAAKQPKLKFQSHDSDGKFVTHYFTSKYNTSSLGTWQKLSCKFSISTNEVSGLIGIEKGTKSSMAIAMQLKDVVLSKKTVVESSSKIAVASLPLEEDNSSYGTTFSLIDGTFVYQPKRIDTPILNKGYGLTFPNYGYIQKLPEEVKQWCDIAYTRFTWAELEPKPGEYAFDKLKNWINSRRANGYRVAFGIMSSNAKDQVAPLWLFDKKNIPGVTHSHKYKDFIDPVYWDKKYLKELSNFIKMLGNELNGGENIEFMDMRNIGVYGEMHFGFEGLQGKGAWTEDELSKHGFSEEKYIEAYQSMITDYKEAFPKTDLVLNIAAGKKRLEKLFGPGFDHVHPGKDDIIQFAAHSGINLRWDGLSMGNDQSMSAIASYYHEFGIQTANSTEGVKCIYEFAKNEDEFSVLEFLLSEVEKNPTSYLNVNFKRFEDMTSDELNILKETAKKIGFRFVLNEIRSIEQKYLFNQTSQMFEIEHQWENVGIAPCYKNNNIVFSFENEEEEIAFVDIEPEMPTWKWNPDQDIVIKTLLSIPADIEEGIYWVKVKMYNAKDNDIVKLAIDGIDANGKYKLFQLKITNDAKGRTITPL